jgi:hypothetical protein
LIAGSRRHTVPNALRCPSFRKKRGRVRDNFGQFPQAREPNLAISVSYVASLEFQLRESHSVPMPSPRQKIQASPSMHLTIAHVSPIISLIAGVLILIMPRLLNFIVAIFLILNGLIGLGLLRWLHF